MADNNIIELAEAANALYYFRERGREYVTHPTSDNKALFIRALFVVAQYCCHEKNADDFWESIGKDVSKYIEGHVQIPPIDEMVHQLTEKESLIYQSATKTSSLEKLINQYKSCAIKLQKEAQVQEVAKEDVFTREIKNELALYVEKSKTLSAEEKEKMQDALKQAVTIQGKSSKKDNRFDFTIVHADGTKYSIKGVYIKVFPGSDILDRETNRPLISRYKSISDATAKQIVSNKGNINIKTAVHQKVAQSKKDEAAKQKIQEKMQELNEKIVREYVRMATGVLSQRLLLDVARGGERLKQDFNFSEENVRQFDLLMMQNIISSEAIWKFYTQSYAPRGSERAQNFYQYLVDRASEIRTADGSWPTAFEKFYADNKEEKNPTLLAEKYKEFLGGPQFNNDLHLNIRKDIGLKRLFTCMTKTWGVDEKELNQRLQFFNDVLGAVEADKDMQTKVEFEYIPVRHKTTGLTGMRAQAENGGDIILKDMNARVKDPLHKIEALMYRLGELMVRHPTIDLTKPSRFRDEEVWKLYQKFKKNGLGDQAQWNDFVQDKYNIATAQTVYRSMQLPEIFGSSSEDYIKWLERDVGTNQQPELPLVNNSIHHLVYRRYAGLIAESFEDGKAKFNNVNNLVDTVSLHPLLFDAHREIEHRFDLGGRFLVRREGKLVGCDFPGIREGDVLLMPVTKVKRKNEKAYRRLMESGTMMMLADQPIMQPHLPFFAETKPSMWQNKRLVIANQGEHGNFVSSHTIDI